MIKSLRKPKKKREKYFLKGNPVKKKEKNLLNVRNHSKSVPHRTQWRQNY